MLIPQQVILKKEPLWVQVHDCPVGMMNQTYGVILGQLIDEVEDIDVNKDSLGWGPFLRIKFWIDITKPFIRGNLFNYKGTQL